MPELRQAAQPASQCLFRGSATCNLGVVFMTWPIVFGSRFPVLLRSILRYCSNFSPGNGRSMEYGRILYSQIKNGAWTMITINMDMDTDITYSGVSRQEAKTPSFSLPSPLSPRPDHRQYSISSATIKWTRVSVHRLRNSVDYLVRQIVTTGAQTHKIRNTDMLMAIDYLSPVEWNHHWPSRDIQRECECVSVLQCSVLDGYPCSRVIRYLPN